MNTVTITETKNTISVNETTNTVTIQEGQATVVTVATEGPQGPAFADGDIGDIVISGGGTVATIDAGAINTAKIADDAVNSDKLASGLLLSAGTNKNIRFAGNIGEIGSVTGFQAVNDAENANTDFGIRATTIRLATGSAERLRVKDAGIDVTGDITATGDLTITSATPIINLTDSNNDSDYQIKNGNGDFNIKDVTNNANRLSINSSGRVDVAGNLDVGSGLDVTGNITVTGTVDGRDLVTDGIKLDGIAAGATADQTASDIKTLLNSDGLTNSQISGSAAIAGTKISPDFGSQNITSTGNISANAVSGASFSGNGASITNIDAANIASGQIASARVPTLNQNTTGSAATLTTARTIAGVSFDGSANISLNNNAITNGAGYLTSVGTSNISDNAITTSKLADMPTGRILGREASGDGDPQFLTASEARSILNVADGATNVTNTNQLTNGAGFITSSDGITGNAASATVLVTARTIAGASFDGSANIDISYTDLTNKLTVGDGGLTQNNFTNTLKTKLDGIAVGATNVTNTNQLTNGAGFLTSVSTSDISDDAITTAKLADMPSQRILGREASGTGDPQYLTATETRSILNVEDGATADQTAAEILTLLSDQNIATTGNITVGGTVDGVDIATRDTLFGGLTASSGVLTDGVTATTQSASDNSTKVATTAYTDTAISNLIDSSPSTLNTLNELAAALGDDANFSTTVTNSIATKLPLAGGQITGNITCSGSQTFDGRDLSVDGAKLDGIESGATADQTKSDIDALGIAASTATTLANARTIAGVSFDGSADISLNNNAITNGAGYITATLTNEQVQDIVGGMLTGNTETGITVTYQDGDGTIDFVVGTLNQDTTGNAATATALETARTIAGTSFDGSANIDISYTNLTNKLSVGDGGLTQNNFTDTLKTKLDGIETGATADQTASEIVALVADQTIAPSEIDMEDNEKIKIGDSQDLQIYHISSQGSIINHFGANHLVLRSGNNIDLRSGNDDSYFAKFVEDGTAEIYFDGSKKLDTQTNGTRIYDSLGIGADSTSTALLNLRTPDGSSGNNTTKKGIIIRDGAFSDGELIDCRDSTGSTFFSVGGDLNVNLTDNHKLQLGDSQDLAIWHSGSHSYIQNITNNLYIHSNELVLRSTSQEEFIDCSVNGSVDLFYDDVKKLETTSTGAQVTGNLRVDGQCDLYDDKRVRLGDSADFQIYHDSTNSLIDNGTGDLYINSAGGIFIAPNNDEAGVYVRPNGAVELYYDNSLKFLTQSFGAEFKDNVKFDNPDTAGRDVLWAADYDSMRWQNNTKATFGDSDDLQIYHDNTANRIQATTAFPTYIEIPTGQKLEINHAQLEVMARFNPDTSVELMYNNSKKFETTSSGANVTGKLGINVSSPVTTLALQDTDPVIHIIRNYGSGSSDIGSINFGNNNIDSDLARITAVGDGATDNAALVFKTQATGNVATERLRIDSSGNVQIANDSGKLQLGASQDLQIFHDGSNSYITNSGTGNLYIDGDTDDLVLQAGDDVRIQTQGNEDAIQCIGNGAVELYYDNDKKFETASIGVYSKSIMPSSHETYDIGQNMGRWNNIFIADSGKLRIGQDDDLQIYHDGTDSIITNSTGDLKITDTSDDITITAADDIRLRPQGGENGINVLGDGSVELYYDNSQKLATFSGGISVTGQVNSDGSHMGDNDKAVFGNSNDLEIYHNGTTSNSFIVNGTGQLQIRSDQLGMTPNGGGEYMFFANKDGNVELYYDGSKKFETTSAGVEVSGNVTFAGDSNTHISHPQADYLKITTGGNEVMSFTDASNIFVPDSRKLMFGDNVDLQIYHDGTRSYLKNATDELRLLSNTTRLSNEADNETYIFCVNNGKVDLKYDNSTKLETTSSGVTVTGTVTETSDIALKSNIEPLNNALEKIKQITGYKYNLNSQASMGVIAQDVEKVLPELVHGFEGKKSLQYSGLIGVLVEAVKELSAKVAALEAA